MRDKVTYIVVWGAILVPIERADGRWTWGLDGIVDGSEVYAPCGHIIESVSKEEITKERLMDVEISDWTDEDIDTFDEV